MLAFVAVTFLGASSVSASPKTPPAGTLRIGTSSASWQVDPALAYISSAWELEYATCAKLVNYPDSQWDDHEATLLRPEIAAAMPTVSQDGLTYTFQIRNDYAFSPPATGVVTAQSMKYTFERTLSPELASPAQQYFTNIVGEVEFHNGQANEITGIVADGDTLTFHLIEPEGEFLTLLAMPFTCAVPIGLPLTEQFAPIPSAGPYYISSNSINQQLITSRNPNYTGPRPQRFDTIEYEFNLNEETGYQQVLSGDLDVGPLPAAHVQEVANLYGPDSPAATRGLQQFFVAPSMCIGMLAMNTSRPTFADVNMRKAVNYAVERTAYAAQAGPYAATPNDQYLPPGEPGFEDIQAYPDQADLETARELAGWQPGDPTRPIAVYYRSSGTENPAQAQIVRQGLIQIGFDPTMVPFSGQNIYEAIGTRGEPFDLAVSVGWCEDRHDPWAFIQLLDGTTIHDGPGNNNWAYFDDPVFNDRMHAANELSGDERYDAFQQIEHDLVRDAAPWAGMRTFNNRYLFSRRTGCQHFQGAYGVDLAQLCVRPAITTDDTLAYEPGLVARVAVRLSSDVNNTVTVDYATADGTAHAGDDYVSASGTLTFGPHARVRYVDVTIVDDGSGEPDETFFLNLSNESSGTMVDPQSVVTITETPPPPPPPPPPPSPLVIGTINASWPTDPALSDQSGWEIEYATCAKLVNYPDASWDEQEASRLRPEIATAMPTISGDRRTYTFQIRDDYAFSPPATGFVTAQSMKYTFERTLSPAMFSPAHQFFTNIVGEIEYHNGQANEITGIVADGATLTIHLIEPEGDFLSMLALPYLCAVPTTMPPREHFAPIPSAGPYYISENDINQQLTLTRNPNYHGPRPQRFDSIRYKFNLNEETGYQQVLSGDLDWGPLPAAHVQEVANLYGPGSPAAQQGLQQFFFEPASCTGFLPMNTSRPLFANVNMRKAVNYAIDRTVYAAQAGPYAGSPFDQYLPPGMSGYEDINAYPDHPNVALARDLAGWHPGDPLRPITVYYRTSGTANQAQYLVVKSNLEQIGFEVTGVGFSGGNIYDAIGTRGEPFDLAVSVGWCDDRHDPWNYLHLLDGTTIHNGPGNNNWAYFDDPVFNDRLHAANELSGDERFDAFRDIEHDLVSDAAPWAAVRLYNNRYLFSRRVGCHHHQLAYGIDLVQLCVRPAITTDDTLAYEPDSGTTVVHVPVRLSSEMDDEVTVHYSTADGTAHAGEDYVAASGTLSFDAHERLKTVDVTVDLGRGDRARRDVLRQPVVREQRDVGRPAVGGHDHRDASASTSTSTSTASTSTASTASATATTAATTTTTATAAATSAAATPPPPPPGPPAAAAASSSPMHRAVGVGNDSEPRASPDPVAALLRRAGHAARTRERSDACSRRRLEPARSGPAGRRSAWSSAGARRRRPRSRACPFARRRRRSVPRSRARQGSRRATLLRLAATGAPSPA